jgi:hypothetical protein
MFAIVLGVFLVADPTPEPAPAVPRGEGPLLVTAQVEDGKLVSRREVSVTVPVQVTEKVNVNGAIETRTRTVYRTEKRAYAMEWDLKKATFQAAGGKKIDRETAYKLLAKPRPVAVSSDGKPVDPAWLKALAKSTLVIVAQRAAPAPTVGTAPAGRPRRRP